MERLAEERKPLESLSDGLRHLLLYGLIGPHGQRGRGHAFGLLHPSRHQELQALWRCVAADVIAYCRTHAPDDPIFDVMNDRDRPRLVFEVLSPELCMVSIAAPSESPAGCFGAYALVADDDDEGGELVGT
jgi:hypothetical protein